MRNDPGVHDSPRRPTTVTSTTTQRPILIPELLPFYSNFLAFKPSKRVYLGNIIAEEATWRRRAMGDAGRGWPRKKKVEVPTLINLRPKMVKPR